MHRLNSGLLWLVIAALAFAAVLAFGPGTASAQTADEIPAAACANEGAGGFKAAGPMPPPLPNVVGKNDFIPVSNLKEKKVDLVLIKNDFADPAIAREQAILSKQPGIFNNITPIMTVQDAVDAVNVAFNAPANNRAKLNVFIAGHGLPGQAEVGNDVIGNENQGQQGNQAAFIQGLKGKIEHLKFIECLTGFGARGQAFLNKLQTGLGAVRVEGFTNLLRPWPKLTDHDLVPNQNPPKDWEAWYAKPEHEGFRQFANTFTVDRPGGKKTVTGSQGQCYSKRTDTLDQTGPDKLWHVVSCVPVPAFPWNRIDIFVVTQKGYPVTDVHFVCLANPTLKAVGSRKVPIKYQVQTPPYSDEEQWSGSFPNNKCPGAVEIYLQPPPIPGPYYSKQLQELKKVVFSNPVGGIVVDPDTSALQLQSDSSSSSDAWLLAEVIAGTAAAAFVLGGGAWYVRRRRMP